MKNLNKKQLADSLKKTLKRKSNLKTKKWFDNYLKGSIVFRGIKRPAVFIEVKKWVEKNNIQTYPIEQKLKLAEFLFSSPYAEDKFAGNMFVKDEVIKNSQHFSKQDSQMCLDHFNYFFKKEFFRDWCTTDWFCVGVLDPFIIKNKFFIAKQILKWKKSKNFWQRRASIVSFRKASLDKSYHPMIKDIIKDLVDEDQRFIQTGIGWVLSDMSKKYPQESERLFRKYMKKLHTEVIDRHTKHLKNHKTLKRLKRSINR